MALALEQRLELHLEQLTVINLETFLKALL